MARRNNGRTSLATKATPASVPDTALSAETSTASASLNDALAEMGMADAPAETVEPDVAPAEGDDAGEPAAEEKSAFESALDELEAGEVEPDANPDVEEITITDAEGKKTVKIDYSDREAIKRAVQKAAGVDKLYGRYKELRDQTQQLETKLAEQSKALEPWTVLEKTYGEGGVAGLHNLVTALTKKEPTVAVEVARQILARHEATAKMTPEQLAQHQARLAQEQEAAEAQRFKSEADKLREEMASIRAESALSRAQSAVDSQFPKYSFVGRLGNPAHEQRLDKFLFNQLQSQLAQAESEGRPITPELVDLYMKSISDLIPEVIRTQAKKMASTQRDGASAKAKKALQSAALRGSSGAAGRASPKVDLLNASSVAQMMEQAMNSGRRR